MTIVDPDLFGALEHLASTHDDFVAALKLIGSRAKQFSSPKIVRASDGSPAAFRVWKPHRFIISFSRVPTNTGEVPQTFSLVHDPDGAPVCFAQDEEHVSFRLPLPGGHLEARRKHYRVIHGSLPAILRTSGFSLSYVRA